MGTYERNRGIAIGLDCAAHGVASAATHACPPVGYIEGAGAQLLHHMVGDLVR